MQSKDIKINRQTMVESEMHMIKKYGLSACCKTNGYKNNWQLTLSTNSRVYNPIVRSCESNVGIRTLKVGKVQRA